MCGADRHNLQGGVKSDVVDVQGRMNNGIASIFACQLVRPLLCLALIIKPTEIIIVIIMHWLWDKYDR